MALHIIWRFFLGVGITLLNACVTPVELDYDTTRDFTRLHGYAWLAPSQGSSKDTVLYNALTDKRIRQSADNVLAARGFRRVDPASADFLVTYHLGIEKKLDTSRVGFGVGYGWSHSSAMVGDGLDIDQYEEESLLIDVLDGHTRELLWRGGVREPLDRYVSPQERTAHIHRQVVDILTNFRRVERIPDDARTACGKSSLVTRWQAAFRQFFPRQQRP